MMVSHFTVVFFLKKLSRIRLLVTVLVIGLVRVKFPSVFVFFVRILRFAFSSPSEA